MHRIAFARARRFLNYHPVAQGSAIGASILTAVAFFALLLLLMLFADLIVNRGEIPSYLQLSAAEQAVFQADAVPPEDAESVLEVTRQLKYMGFAPSDVRGWLNGTPLDKLSHR